MDIEFRPMTQEQFALFKQKHVEAQIPDLAKSFAMEEKAARVLSEMALKRSLPKGRRTKQQYFFEAVGPDGALLGHLWFCKRELLGKKLIFICDIFVEESARGLGVGKKMLLWMEQETKRLGFDELALHVFGNNARARKLYETVGFSPTSIQMSKRNL